MGLDREARESIQGTEREIQKRTSVNSTRFRQKIRMEVNTLDYAMGEVLSMGYENRK